MRDALGYLAGALVLSTFSATSMRLLRILGIASNCAFISYAVIAHAMPILVLHALLLPINLVRLAQLQSWFPMQVVGRAPVAPPGE